jgi:hypothetical protein
VKLFHAEFDCLSSMCDNSEPVRLRTIMKSSLNPISIRKKHGHVARSLALFFLLFTGADLFLPQYFCGGEEVGRIPVNGQTVSSTSKANTPFIATAFQSDNSRPDQPEDREHHEEDCFCCCAHVLPGAGFGNLVVLDLISLPAPPSLDSLLSPPLQVTYHPPRIA